MAASAASGRPARASRVRARATPRQCERRLPSARVTPQRHRAQRAKSGWLPDKDMSEEFKQLGSVLVWCGDMDAAVLSVWDDPQLLWFASGQVQVPRHRLGDRSIRAAADDK